MVDINRMSFANHNEALEGGDKLLHVFQESMTLTPLMEGGNCD